MSEKSIYWTGIIGVTLFAVASILAGFQFDDYSPTSQLISESMAVDTPYGKVLRYLGYIPSGILLTTFSLSAVKKFPPSNLVKFGFFGLAIFYGIATIIVGIFPCDKGCNKELVDPSTSQLIHNLTGLLTYVFVPLSILAIGIGLRKLKEQSNLSNIAILCALNSIAFVGMLVIDPTSNYAGLFQRVIELTFIIWIVCCSIEIKKNSRFDRI